MQSMTQNNCRGLVTKHQSFKWCQYFLYSYWLIQLLIVLSAKRIAFLKATKREHFKISKINHLQNVVSYFLMNIWSKMTSIHPSGALGKEFCQRQVLQDFSFVPMFALPRLLCTTFFFGNFPAPPPQKKYII